jgi:superfamily II DNA or RNA helicase
MARAHEHCSFAEKIAVKTEAFDYQSFLSRKAVIDPPTGLSKVPALNPALFDFQRDIDAWALRRGRAAIFADCGLGKTPMQLEWAKHVPGPVLILAPLAVAGQTMREGEKFGIEVRYARSQAEVSGKITVANYEMLAHFDPSHFAGVVLDESSILKSYDGATRTAIIEAFRQTPFRLACTATPAPNDYMELGNHAEFLGVMSRVEMLAMFFVHDGGETQKWRLKGHAEPEFWKWLCSWAVMIRKPSDLGYPDGDFKLPELVMHEVEVAVQDDTMGQLFPVQAQTLQERLQARRSTISERVADTAAVVNATADPFLVWCNLNDESHMLAKAIPGAVEVSGSDSNEAKERAMLGFSRGEIRVLVTKPSIAGFGMNWQHCNNMAFVGLSDSYEQFYQAVRRCWRFGQTRPVNVYVVTAETEGAVVANIKRKEADAMKMAENMVEHMKDLNSAALHGGIVRSKDAYVRERAVGEGWELHLADCVELASEIPSDSLHYTIYSPPFASLYTYSNSDRDMGNCKDDDEFMEHYRFLVRELYRATMPGRLVSFHCMNLPTSKQNHGYIGIRDFRGELIRLHEAEGWIFHSEVCIWKDPVTAMQRTKALGLLWKQLKKDSCMSRQGIPDYLVTMRKPGTNPENVSHTAEDFPVELWQNFASPVWHDINPSDTITYREARENEDERHICALQLQVIERGIKLWSNPGDLVFSPFAGVGSEGYQAIKMGRRFLGSELKRSYWEQACRNLEQARKEQAGLFA